MHRLSNSKTEGYLFAGEDYSLILPKACTMVYVQNVYGPFVITKKYFARVRYNFPAMREEKIT